MNSIENLLYDKYMQELSNLELGYSFDTKTIKSLIELVCTDIYVHSEYPKDDELLKYLKQYD